MPAYNPNLQPDNSILTNLRVSGRAAAPVQVTAPNRTTFVKGLGDAMMQAEAMKLRMPTEVERAKQMEINRLAAANDPSLVEGKLQADLNRARAMTRLLNSPEYLEYEDAKFQRGLDRKLTETAATRAQGRRDDLLDYEEGAGMRQSQMDEQIAYKQRMLNTINEAELQNDVNRLQSPISQLELQNYLKKYNAVNAADLENKLNILTDPRILFAEDAKRDRDLEFEVKRINRMNDVELQQLAAKLQLNEDADIRLIKRKIEEVSPAMDSREIELAAKRLSDPRILEARAVAGDFNRSQNQMDWGLRQAQDQAEFDRNLANEITRLETLSPIERREAAKDLRSRLRISSEQSFNDQIRAIEELLPRKSQAERDAMVDAIFDPVYNMALDLEADMLTRRKGKQGLELARWQAITTTDRKVGEARKFLENETRHNKNLDIISAARQQGYIVGTHNPDDIGSTRVEAERLLDQIGKDAKKLRTDKFKDADKKRQTQGRLEGYLGALRKGLLADAETRAKNATERINAVTQQVNAGEIDQKDGMEKIAEIRAATDYANQKQQQEINAIIVKFGVMFDPSQTDRSSSRVMPRTLNIQETPTTRPGSPNEYYIEER